MRFCVPLTKSPTGKTTLKIQEFNERLKDAILIADGAMGSLLHETVGRSGVLTN